MSWHYLEDRVLCNVLDEMRSCYKTRNFAQLLGLIEEVQIMANRMEASLSQKSSLQEWDHEWRKKRARLKALNKEIKEKEDRIEQLNQTETGQKLIKAVKEIEKSEGLKDNTSK